MSCLSLYDPAGRSLDTVIVCFRLVADLAAQLIALGPWKVVYDQLQVLNPPWFEQHAIRCPEQPVGSGERCHTTGKPCVCSHVYSSTSVISSLYSQDLVTGATCVVMGWSCPSSERNAGNRDASNEV